jgi:hypothetical protein
MRRRVFEIHGHICHWCGHPGAEQVDHLFTVDAFPDLAWTRSNLLPVHGRRCPQCGQGCNTARQAALARGEVRQGQRGGGEQRRAGLAVVAVQQHVDPWPGGRCSPECKAVGRHGTNGSVGRCW